MKGIVIAAVLAAASAVAHGASVGGAFDVDIVLAPPGGPAPPGGGATPADSGGLCVSQGLSSATGAVVNVVCGSGQFVSIEAQPGSSHLGVHGGAFRYYFTNGIPADLRYLGGTDAWVGPGTVTSIRVQYLDDLDGVIEMQVGF